jgi:acetyl-CoA acetyltransferase family protein
MPTEHSERDAVFIDGRRLPFVRSGTQYADLTANDLARMVLRGFVEHANVDVGVIEAVVMGTVIQDVDTSNVAREAALGAGFPPQVFAHTVTMACISSNQAVATIADAIRLGRMDVGIAGGTETLSDIPIRFKRSVRRRLLASQKAKSPADYLKLLRSLRPSDLLPDVPSISEYSTGETMGESADKLAASWGVPRVEQDEYAMRSHHRAALAQTAGTLRDEIIPAFVGREMAPVTQDNGVRGDTSMETLGKLRPAFVKPYGTVTAGNASFLTDGASALLLSSREAASRYGWSTAATIRDYLFVGQQPEDELLLGPAYAIPRLLERNELTMDDIDVFEIHEAFAGQVLAVQKALESPEFARKASGSEEISGSMPLDKMNLHGGSLSLGHPFGATGARLVTTAIRRLQRENGRYAIVAACAAGGLGHAMLIERD